jgi:hypothetical protein
MLHHSEQQKKSEEATREGSVRVLVATVLRGEGDATCAPKFFSVTVEGAGTLVVVLPKKESKPALFVVLPKKESKPELVSASGAVE